ncbi:MAG: hypothetical protein ACRCUY_09675 [Thermoguttaceae bacterium]
MKNDQFLQMTLIFAVIVIIGLSVGIWMIYDKQEGIVSANQKALEDAKRAEQEVAQKEADVAQLKGFLGYIPQTPLASSNSNGLTIRGIEDFHKGDKELFAKEANDIRYRRMLEWLFGKLRDVAGESSKSQAERLQLQSKYDNLLELHDKICASHSRDLAENFGKLTENRNEFRTDTESTKQEIGDTQKKFIELQVQKAKELQEAKEKSVQLAKDLNEISKRTTEMNQLYDDFVQERFEIPDGEITAVNQDAGTVIINRGFADYLLPRMTFSVYPSTFNEQSLISEQGNSETILCDICKRNPSLSASKGTIEVIKIVGPHQAEARIVDDPLYSPFVPGDIFYTPMWTPGQKIHYAFLSSVRLPGSTSESPASDMKSLKEFIEMNGGKVDLYFDENGDAIGEITPETNYLIIGDIALETEKDKQLRKDTVLNAVQVLPLGRLLSEMGWRKASQEQKEDSDTTPTFRKRSPSDKSSDKSN